MWLWWIERVRLCSFYLCNNVGGWAGARQNKIYRDPDSHLTPLKTRNNITEVKGIKLLWKLYKWDQNQSRLLAIKKSPFPWYDWSNTWDGFVKHQDEKPVLHRKSEERSLFTICITAAPRGLNCAQSPIVLGMVQTHSRRQSLPWRAYHLNAQNRKRKYHYLYFTNGKSRHRELH